MAIIPIIAIGRIEGNARIPPADTVRVISGIAFIFLIAFVM
jgi:hypothetical protein